MDKTISTTSQTTLTNTSTADTNAHNYYIARWVSPQLNQTSVAANTWTVEIAVTEANTNANFPRNGAGAGRVCCYVWKPSNGTKYGDILDGNTAADAEEAGTTQTVSTFTFSGSAVSSLTAGDAVIVFELWAIVTQGMATGYVQTVAYDGTTENSTSNEAAFISTPENLVFAYTRALATETVSSSETLDRLLAATRALATETTSISESVTRVLGKVVSMATETVTIGENLVRQLAATRAMSTETTTSGETLTRTLGANRTSSDTVSIGENLSRVLAATRTIIENTSIGESLTRMLAATRTFIENISISDLLEFVYTPGSSGTNYTRTITETVDISESVARLLSATRAITETVSTSESLTRMLSAFRTLDESVSISENLNRLLSATRTLATEVVSIADSIATLFHSGSGTHFVVSLIENVPISDTLRYVAFYIFRPKSRDPLERPSKSNKHTSRQWYKNPFHRTISRVRQGFGRKNTEGKN